MASKFDYDTPADGKIGSVRSRLTKTVTIDIDAVVAYNDTDADEFILTLNGRPLRRLSPHQAHRFGLTNP